MKALSSLFLSISLSLKRAEERRGEGGGAMEAMEAVREDVLRRERAKK